VSDLLDQCSTGTAAPANNTGYATDSIAAWGELAVFITPEYQQNKLVNLCFGVNSNPVLCDLNHDGDANDRVLMAAPFDDNPLNVWSARKAADEFQLSAFQDAFIAFRVPETAEGNTELNGDSDTNDSVLHVWFPYCTSDDVPMGLVLSSNWSALPCTFSSCELHEPYRVQGNLIWFLTDDKQPGPIALAAMRADRCTVLPAWIVDVIALEPPPFHFPIFPERLLGQDVLIRSSVADESAGAANASGLWFAGDYDGDSILDPLDNCVAFPNADLLDVDRDGVGDRRCDLTPASCPAHAIAQEKCDGPTQLVSGGLCAGGRRAKRRLVWNWQPGEETGHPKPLPDPSELLPHFSLCVYGENGEPVMQSAVLPWERCGKPPCWDGTKDSGFTYRADPTLAGTLDGFVLPGMQSADGRILASGVLSEAGAQVLGENNTVQLIMRLGKQRRCWSSQHARPLALNKCTDPGKAARAAKRSSARSHRSSAAD
jgi:hypothetical protein